MHSGYPIVTHLDVCEKSCINCILDLNKMKTVGNWGLFHEIGHNMQRPEWTFEGIWLELFKLKLIYRQKINNNNKYRGFFRLFI